VAGKNETEKEQGLWHCKYNGKVGENNAIALALQANV